MTITDPVHERKRIRTTFVSYFSSSETKLRNEGRNEGPLFKGERCTGMLRNPPSGKDLHISLFCPHSLGLPAKGKVKAELPGVVVVLHVYSSRSPGFIYFGHSYTPELWCGRKSEE